MRFTSRDETCDSNTPSSSSSRMLINGAMRRKSSNETIRSYRGSISNSSVHTISTAESLGSASGSHKDLSDLPGQCPAASAASTTSSRHSSESSTGQYPSIFKSLEKPTCLSRNRNQSLSSIFTTREPNSDCESDIGYTSPPTPKQEHSSLSFPTLEDEAEIPLPSTLRSPNAIIPTRTTKAPSPRPSPGFAIPPPPLNGPLMKSYDESQLFTTTGISSTGATRRRHKRMKEKKANDADLMKRLRGICKDADRTRSYRNLVKIGRG